MNSPDDPPDLSELRSMGVLRGKRYVDASVVARIAARRGSVRIPLGHIERATVPQKAADDP